MQRLPESITGWARREVEHRRRHSHLPSDSPSERPKKPVEIVIRCGHVKTIEVFGMLVSFALNRGLEPLVGFAYCM